MSRTTDRARPPGRPRDPETHAAVLYATRRLLLERGYHRLTFEAVATAAETTRSTLYRWWPTRGALAMEAAADHLDIGEVPDSGDSREDLRIAIRQLIDTFSDRLAGIVILAAIANLDDDPTMARTFRERWVYPWRTTAADAIERAVERGVMSPTADVQFILNVIVGTVFQCTITPAEPMTDGLETALLDLVLPTTQRTGQGPSWTEGGLPRVTTTAEADDDVTDR